MDKHYGQIVELIIRKQGFSISELARLANINRKCVYNWFNQKYLKPDIILRVGRYIKHDFSVEFPELFTPDQFNDDVFLSEIYDGQMLVQSENGIAWKDKYIELLERYNSLLLDHYQKNV